MCLFFSLEPLSMDNAAFPFLAFSGIPSLSFRFTSSYLVSHPVVLLKDYIHSPGRNCNTNAFYSRHPHQMYPYFGTKFDTREQLNAVTSNQIPQLAVAAAHFAGHIALRLVHDHLLQLDVTKYDKVIRTQVAQINSQIKDIKRVSFQSMLTSSYFLAPL